MKISGGLFMKLTDRISRYEQVGNPCRCSGGSEVAKRDDPVR